MIGIGPPASRELQAAGSSTSGGLDRRDPARQPGRGMNRGAGVPKRKSPPTPDVPAFVPPYPPSWVNRLFHWIDRRPGPAWGYYGLAVVVSGAMLVLAQWLGGEAAASTFGPNALVFAFYPVYFVALTHYLDRQARSALEAFRPALGADEATSNACGMS